MKASCNPACVHLKGQKRWTAFIQRLFVFFSFQVIFLIGNKSDLEAQRDVTYEEAKQFADENGMK